MQRYRPAIRQGRRLRRAGVVAAARDAAGTGIEGTVIESVTGEVRKVDLARIKRLDLGEVDLTDIAVAFSDARIFKALGYENKPALLLGIDALRAFDRVSIDFGQRKVRFVVPDDRLARFKSAARLPSGEASRAEDRSGLLW